MAAMPNPHAAKRFGRYLLIHRIAVGGMAEIFLALEIGAATDRQIVVIKRIRKDLGDNKDFVRMFIDEERVISRLSHPSIVKVHDFGRIEGRYFIALEHVWGESLARLTQACQRQKQSFPVAAALYIGAQIAQALHCAHSHRDDQGRPSPVIHRDVTLGNVVVAYDGQVKVVDFGIAKAEDRLTETKSGVIKGTLAYLAPEQLKGGGIGPATDIYQLGVLLYKLLVGQEPLQADSNVTLMAAILKGSVRPPHEIVTGFPAGLERVLLKAMAVEPAARFPSAASFQGVLRYLLGDTYAQGQAGLAEFVRRLTGNRQRRQKQIIDALLDSGGDGDALDELAHWQEPQNEPRTVNVELSAFLDPTSMVAADAAPAEVTELDHQAPASLHELSHAPAPVADDDPFDPPRQPGERTDVMELLNESDDALWALQPDPEAAQSPFPSAQTFSWIIDDIDLDLGIDTDAPLFRDAVDMVKPSTQTFHALKHAPSIDNEGVVPASDQGESLEIEIDLSQMEDKD